MPVGSLLWGRHCDIASAMLKHNAYFENQVQSIEFQRNGRRASVGVVDEGEYAFDTGSAERMTVVSGELVVKRAGDEAWVAYPAGTAFEVAAKSRFEVRIAAPSAYLCEYL